MNDDAPLTSDEESALADDLGCTVSDVQDSMATVQTQGAAFGRIRVSVKRRARALAAAIRQASL